MHESTYPLPFPGLSVNAVNKEVSKQKTENTQQHKIN